MLVKGAPRDMPIVCDVSGCHACPLTSSIFARHGMFRRNSGAHGKQSVTDASMSLVMDNKEGIFTFYRAPLLLPGSSSHCISKLRDFGFHQIPRSHHPTLAPLGCAAARARSNSSSRSRSRFGTARRKLSRGRHSTFWTSWHRTSRSPP